MGQSEDDNRELAAKILKYTTPLTIALLITIAVLFFEDNPIAIAIIGVMILFEAILGARASWIYDKMTEDNKEEE